MKKPLYESVAERIEKYIIEMNLLPGDKLPSYRSFADILGVSANTVSNAIERLNHKGVLKILPQSGVFVMQDAWTAMFPKQFNWYEYFNRSKKLPIQFLRQWRKFSYDMSHIALLGDETWERLFEEAVARAVSQIEARSLIKMDWMGYPPLCEAIKDYMQHHGVTLRDNNILITKGINQSLLSLILTFFSPGTLCYFVSPSALEVSAVFDITGVIREPLPAGSDGVDISYFTSRIKKKAKRTKSFFLVMPVNHAISGTTMSLDKRRELYNVCYANNIPIIELDEYRELAGAPLPPIKAFDKHDIVFYVASFSKLFSSSLDVGWVAASAELIERLSYVRSSMWFGGEKLLQCITYNLLKHESFSGYIRQMRTILKNRRDAVNGFLDEYMGDIATWDRDFEFFFWLKFHDFIDIRKMAANSENIAIADHAQYAFGEKNAIFISITAFDEDECREAIKQISLLARRSFEL